jgi:hypothetical protein
MDDRRITVAVCGDSFCAASVNILEVTGTGDRAHFSQMLEDAYGYRVLHMAHGGFSNAAILFQIREAILKKADVVIYNKTWSNRLELSLNDTFNLSDGLHNFFYYDPNLVSSHTPWAGGPRSAILSSTHHGIDSSPFFEITKEQKQAIDLYLKYLYTDNLKTIMDEWLFDYWNIKAKEAGVLPIYFNQAGVGKVAYDFSLANPTYDTPFHTDRATQVQITDNIHRYIVDNLPR